MQTCDHRSVRPEYEHGKPGTSTAVGSHRREKSRSMTVVHQSRVHHVWSESCHLCSNQHLTQVKTLVRVRLGVVRIIARTSVMTREMSSSIAALSECDLDETKQINADSGWHVKLFATVRLCISRRSCSLDH